MPQDAPPILRPLALTDILDQAISLYRRNFTVFAGIGAVVYAPIGVLQTVAAYLHGATGAAMPYNPARIPWAQLGRTGSPGLGVSIISLLAVSLAQGALAIAVSRRYLNQPTSVADAYGAIRNRWVLLMATEFVLMLGIMAGIFACVIPGIYLSTLWMLAIPVVALESVTTPAAAASRSSYLVGDHWGRCFGTYLALSLLVMAVTNALVLPISALGLATLRQHDLALAQALTQAITTVATIFIHPVLMVGLVLLYYDLRIRKEGFDLELLARALDKDFPVAPKSDALWENLTPPPPPPPPAAPSHWPGFPPPGPPLGSPPAEAAAFPVEGTVTIPPLGPASSPDETAAVPEPPLPTPSPEAADAALLPPDDDAVTPFNVNSPPPA